MGQAQGTAGRGHPLREARPVLHGRAVLGRHTGLDQALTKPSFAQTERASRCRAFRAVGPSVPAVLQ